MLYTWVRNKNSPKSEAKRIVKMTHIKPISLPISYQIISRSNDKDGNPYRLAIIYKNHSPVCAIEFEDTTVVYRTEQILRKITGQEIFYGLIPFNLTIKEYRETRNRFIQLGQFAEERQFDKIREIINPAFKAWDLQTVKDLFPEFTWEAKALGVYGRNENNIGEVISINEIGDRLYFSMLKNGNIIERDFPTNIGMVDCAEAFRGEALTA